MKKIGFIGTGWVGNAYANDFEQRGYDVVRYSLESRYVRNKHYIKECDIVFIAVPTPTNDKGNDISILRSVLPLVGNDKIAVIKSTIQPGTTVVLSEEFPDIYVVHSPEFLREKTAQDDASFPERNIVGIPLVNSYYVDVAKQVIEVLPQAPYYLITQSVNAELIKYAGNAFLLMKVVFSNMLYDLTQACDGEWDEVHAAWINDARIGGSHTNPISDGGRGAAGDCLLKDFEVFGKMYKNMVDDKVGLEMLTWLKEKNVDLLLGSGKDIELLKKVYPQAF